MTKLAELFGVTIDGPPMQFLSADLLKENFESPTVLFNSLNFPRTEFLRYNDRFVEVSIPPMSLVTVKEAKEAKFNKIELDI